MGEITKEDSPWWATREGTLKLCVKCNQSFKDYTAKLRHTLCRSCWKKAESEAGFRAEKPIEDVRGGKRNFECRSCKGSGKDRLWEDYVVDEPCFDCGGTGIGEIEGTSELELGL